MLLYFIECILILKTRVFILTRGHIIEEHGFQISRIPKLYSKKATNNMKYL